MRKGLFYTLGNYRLQDIAGNGKNRLIDKLNGKGVFKDKTLL